ncbi:MAG: DNA-N1-methyladenine dioxygenase [Polaromonas sp.]|nr:DNA-N1-methyladenine dioxygenase [Polaromonas sp.]
MTADLFDDFKDHAALAIGPGAVLLRGFARELEAALLDAFDGVVGQAPLRHLVTPGGYTMSVAMSNCGALGWVSDRSGYRYLPDDPLTGRPWPPMPALWLDLASRAAEAAGYVGFVPDACLVNEYIPGTKLSLHQDRDEHDLGAPIVSVSLGLPAVFQFGTGRRSDRPQRVRLASGDVVVWGGASRLAYHGIAPLADGTHALTGARRINLTFRKVGQAPAASGGAGMQRQLG